MDHFNSISVVEGKLRKSTRGRISRINREIKYTGTSMENMTPAESLRILFKLGFETQSLIMTGKNVSMGPPVIEIADTLQSHFSAAVGNADGQGMKWMAPKRAITPIMVQNEGSNPRSLFFSTGE